MLEIITNYPLIVWIIVFVVIFLVKNHILASHDEVANLKKQIIEDLKKDKTFVTNEQLSNCEKLIRRDVKADFLSLAVFNEFKTGIDRQFKTIFTRFDEGTAQMKELQHGINDIKKYLLEEKRK